MPRRVGSTRGPCPPGGGQSGTHDDPGRSKRVGGPYAASAHLGRRGVRRVCVGAVDSLHRDALPLVLFLRAARATPKAYLMGDTVFIPGQGRLAAWEVISLPDTVDPRAPKGK